MQSIYERERMVYLEFTAEASFSKKGWTSLSSFEEYSSISHAMGPQDRRLCANSQILIILYTKITPTYLHSTIILEIKGKHLSRFKWNELYKTVTQNMWRAYNKVHTRALARICILFSWQNRKYIQTWRIASL